jgi:SsrA-binding protein
MKLIADNKKARFDYEVLDTYEAGMVLTGSEVKSIRDGSVNLKDAYVSFRGHEAFVQKVHIGVYKASSYNNHEPERDRKLLLNHAELNKLYVKMQERGFSCVPLKMYFKNGRVKLEIALVRGKKQHDKRDALKKKDIAKETRNAMKKERH